MNRHFPLSTYLKSRFGQRVQKVPLDAGFDCPNRDGTISRSGCIFCNPSGSGSGMLSQGNDLRAQWEHWKIFLEKRYKAKLFIAYLQSYSNTHGPIEKLAGVLGELHDLPGLAALSIGTRPDCLDPEKLDLLSDQKQRHGVGEVFLELGLQSACDKTLEHINRGHTAEQFAEVTRQAAERGLNVVAHVMAGLPSPDAKNQREGLQELLNTVSFINELPVSGIKFHNVFVCENTALGAMWKKKQYEPIELEEYCFWLGEALMKLSPDTVVHRLNADPAPGELLAPDWADRKREVHAAIHRHLDAEDIWQGKQNGAESGVPKHFSGQTQETDHAQ